MRLGMIYCLFPVAILFRDLQGPKLVSNVMLLSQVILPMTSSDVLLISNMGYETYVSHHILGNSIK